MTLRLEPGQPAVFIGPMGSGKTNLIAWLLQHHRSVVIVDSKRMPDEWAAWGPGRGYVVSDDPEEIRRSAKVIYQPSMVEIRDFGGYWKDGRPGYRWTRALEGVLARGKTVVVFDELVQQLPAGQAHPVGIQILTQGGAWGISAWGGSQYANRVETMIVRGAVHCFCFTLPPVDRELMRERRGLPLDVELPPFGFAYHRTNTPAWQPCQPVEFIMPKHRIGSPSAPQANEAPAPDRELHESA